MKIRIEMDDTFNEEEVIIRCRGITPDVMALQQAITELSKGTGQMTFYKGETEYYLPMESILFFETDGGSVNAHTVDNIYQTKYKLYELEELLPGYFMRVSKSAILNTKQIYSMTKDISTCVVQFLHTHKQVFVSRYYYKPLKEKLEEKRMNR